MKMKPDVLKRVNRRENVIKVVFRCRVDESTKLEKEKSETDHDEGLRR